jgi:hypothetical protein
LNTLFGHQLDDLRVVLVRRTGLNYQSPLAPELPGVDRPPLTGAAASGDECPSDPGPFAFSVP